MEASRNVGEVLRENKDTYSRIKTEFSHLRDI